MMFLMLELYLLSDSLLNYNFVLVHICINDVDKFLY